MKLVYEHWWSSDNQSEIHFFISGTDKYVFGYNPKYLSKEVVKKILKSVKGAKKRKRKFTANDSVSSKSYIRKPGRKVVS